MRLFSTFLFCLLGAQIAFSQQSDVDFFIKQALNNSPLLQDLNNQVAANRLDSLRLRAGLRPQLNGTVAGLIAPTVKGWGYDNAVTNGGGLAGLISVSQPLIGRDNIAAQTQSIAIQTRSAQNSAHTSAQDIRRTITAQYLLALGDRQQLDFNQELLDLVRREAAVLKRLTETNVYRQTDYLIFLTSLQQQEFVVQALENQWRNDLSMLNYLCGITDTAAVVLREPVLSPLPLPGPNESAFYTPYLLDSLRIQNSEALLDFSYRPKASVVADAGFNSSFLSRGYRNFGLSFGLNLTVPIYDGGQRQLQHDKNTIAEQTRRGYARFFGQQYRQQIAQLYQQLTQTEQLLTQTTGQLKYTQTLLEANGKLLRTGELRIADYILALNNYRIAQNLATQQRIARLQLINQLNYWSL
jgi:outer membrane protein TolC